MRVFSGIFGLCIFVIGCCFGSAACDPRLVPPIIKQDGGGLPERTNHDGRNIPRSDKDAAEKKKPQGCPSSWSVAMSSVQANTRVYAVFCPSPTITGCRSLHKGKACIATSSPLVLFIYDVALKSHAVEHSGSIEENSHGKLVAAPDATQPDRLTGLPDKTKIKALFSGVPISFRFDGDKVTVYAPK